MKFSFIGAAYQALSSNIEAQECTNLFLEVDPEGRNALVLRPGLKLFATVGNGPIRGAHKPVNYDAIVVSGNQVYRVKSDKSTVLLGTISSSSGPVSMADSGTDLVIVDGTSNGYLIDLATYSFSSITAAGFYGADNVHFADQRYIFNRPGTGQFYISKAYTLTTRVLAFDPLEFAFIQIAAENIVSHITDRSEIWLFGEQNVEVWANNGASFMPYERLQGGVMQIGCIASHSVARFDNTVVWLGQGEKGSGIVWLGNNYSPLRISTHAMEAEFQTYSTLKDAQAYVYQQGGHEFYVLTFPTAGKTWVYDAATKAWNQRAYLSNGIQGRERANAYAYAYGLHLVGDYQNGNLYQLDLSTYSDNGDPIKWTRSCHVLQGPDFDWQYFSELQIEMEAGVGLESGLDPQVSLSWSDDGGHTWSNEHFRSMGKMGKYLTRVRWLRLGRSRGRIFRLTGSDPVKTVIINASVK